MKKLLVLSALSFLLVSANYAQTGTRKTDTSTTSHKMMRKNMKDKRNMDSSLNGNGSLYPMNNGAGRADSTNSGNGTITPNTVPGTTPLPGTPGTTPLPSTTPLPGTTPTPTPAPHK